MRGGQVPSVEPRMMVGRDHVVVLIRDLVVRPDVRGRPSNRVMPLLVVEGSGGSGKSELLAATAGLMEQRIPYARLDLGSVRASTVPEILSALAFELSRWCRGYGRLTFPRLVLARLAMTETLDPNDPTAARALLRDRIVRQRGVDGTVAVLKDAADELLGALPARPPVPLSSISRLLIGAARASARWNLAGRLVLGKHFEWFGRHYAASGKPIDALAALSLLARPPVTSTDQDTIDAILIAAFLADLRESFAGVRRRAGRQSLGCAVLLDNADAKPAITFLVAMAAARLQPGGAGVPLAVVAATSGNLTGRVPLAQRVPFVAEDVTFERFAARTGRPPQSSWMRSVLDPLTEEQTAALVRRAGLGVTSNEHLVHLLHRATGGWPRDTSLLLEPLRQHPVAGDPAGHVDLGATCRHLDPDLPGPTPQAALAASLLASVPTDLHAALEICAAARDNDRALQLATQSDLLSRHDLQQVQRYAPLLWRDGTPVLLRRLLLQRLARRPKQWAAVHTWLWEDYLRDPAQLSPNSLRDHTQEAALHHLLASGNVVGVARQIADDWLDKLPGGELLAMLDVVTSAPNPLDHQISPADLLLAATGTLSPADRPGTPLTRLIVARWIADDPFAGVDRAPLHLCISTGYTTLADYCPRGAEALLTEAQRHNDLAEWWA